MARYDDAPLPYSSSGPMPTRNPTLRRANTKGGTVKRSKTLTRPERHVAPEPLINPGLSAQTTPAEGGNWNWWVLTSWIATFYAPPALLRACGFKDKQTQQAWREKVTLCTIAVIMGAFVGFFTMGLQSALCPGGEANKSYQLLGSQNSTLSIGGYAFDISESATPEHINFYHLANNMSGQDITTLFARSNDDFPECQGKNAKYATSPLCPTKDPSGSSTDPICSLPQLSNQTVESLKLKNLTLWEGYSWEQVAELDDYLVLDGFVLNMSPYLSANPNPINDDPVDQVIRRALDKQRGSGKDVTSQFYNSQEMRDAIPCMTSRYLAGHIDKMTPGCFVAALFLYCSLGVILAVVLIRFFMALIFNWFIAHRLVEKQDVHGRAIAPTVMPEGANVSVNNQNGTAPWANGGQKSAPAPIMDMAQIGQDLFTVCLITCYSEGEEGIRGTLDSIAATTFPDQRKLLWIVCDGMITGAGEKMSTPDICVSMLDADPRFGNPQPMGYIAVGSGAKKENRAMVYAGHYLTENGHRTPAVIVVKCGMPSEANDAKPGNRGKRDSQLILMNFFSRCTYNDRMTPLDYDLFRKVQTLMGVTPDFFELCLMVDADTKVYPDSLTHLVHCMANDNRIMGVCGETRIANKRQSWVTAIQVFEYYISHHHIKAFESVFGGVTCLPGCFSMYRIKARKDDDDDWVPILVKPEIVREYSQSDVVTLHQKNLLLLGEDRFLSTIMLRTFPHRRNIFLPQARCRTIAPDEFKVLLSQRRRWINSTIHNLMELVLVRDLCGTFCFSMQFVVFMDLLGTIVLPIAICLTGALVINSIIKPPTDFVEAIPLMLLACILGLPAVLITLTTRKMIYVAWMLVYLCALPVWNFVLPVYSFWHFDDFSWGETRKVEGEVVDKAGHGGENPIFDGTNIPLRRWEDWERSRLRKLRREEKRRKQMERSHGQGFYNDDPDALAIPRNMSRAALSDDSGSIMSSEEDVWGAEIGGYNENHPAYPPPPMALAPNAVSARPGTQVLGMEEMAQLLDQGFEEPPAAAWRPERNESSPLHRHPAQPADFTRTPKASPPNDYRPLSPRSPGGTPTAHASTGVQLQDHGATSTSIESGQHQGQHARQRSKTYGPLGPLDDHQYPHGR